MAQWDHGYVTDMAYTSNAYQEMMPTWLAACATLLGHRPPDLAVPFRHADLGCGNGLTILIAAATNPHAEFWGFDFNPTHIENARLLAAHAKLTNIHFEEVSFEALATGDPNPPRDANAAREAERSATDALTGTFDFVTAHGILSWVSLENRRHLAACIGRLTRPGGLIYLSYNTSTGWAGMEPVRLLMRQYAEMQRHRIDQSSGDIFRLLDDLKNGGATFFRAHPALERRLEDMRKQDPRYLAHEFMNRDWHPVMFADVVETMAETKAIYIGSATAMENLDAVAIPEPLLAMVATTRDQAMRETIRDIASGKNFRRDIWRKGGEALPSYEHMGMVDAIRLAFLGKPAEESITFNGPIGTISGQPEFYRPVTEAIRQKPASIAELRALPGLQGRQMGEFFQAALLLMGGGYVHPVGPQNIAADARAGATRLNRALVQRLRMGVDLRWFAAPLIGSCIGMEIIDGLVIGQLLEGGSQDPEGLIDAVLNDVLQSGRRLLRDGQPLTEPAAARVLIADTVRTILARRFQTLRELGVIG